MWHSIQRLRLALALSATATLGLATGLAAPASAGCGCDHPPPAWSVVMPPFAWAGQPVTLHAVDASFVVGEEYQVKFEGKKVKVVAARSDQLDVLVPSRLKPGPTKIEVKGDDFEYKYEEALFTALPKPFKVTPRNAELRGKDVKMAVTLDGTILVPVDLSRVLDPMQFALQFEGLSLDFENEDVVLYNTQGVDLTVFTLAVDDATERQWGSYYGWAVEDEAGLLGLRYESKVEKSKKKSEQSDVFLYWRHEFHTYADAHAPGGSHEVDASGFHPDGTMHIDHDFLVIAITGLDFPLSDRDKLIEADLEYEEDVAEAKNRKERKEARKKHEKKLEKIRKKAKRLKGGDQKVDIKLLAILAERPIEPDEVISEPLTTEYLELEEE